MALALSLLCRSLSRLLRCGTTAVHAWPAAGKLFSAAFAVDAEGRQGEVRRKEVFIRGVRPMNSQVFVGEIAICKYLGMAPPMLRVRLDPRQFSNRVFRRRVIRIGISGATWVPFWRVGHLQIPGHGPRLYRE